MKCRDVQGTPSKQPTAKAFLHPQENSERLHYMARLRVTNGFGCVLLDAALIPITMIRKNAPELRVRKTLIYPCFDAIQLVHEHDRFANG